ncbi:hypothetical protein F4553_005374 [Allocatelliglobosispora scoriae]|uniref:DUF2637 domain-containing protein n=1 Tax=Allocatelliglobosispora scoriae TaxID=643052 RepID=A0A841BWE4_9ACTN|nr:hypothetical protein [Allocatelliglobosispora scoriae]MBB5871995.1 hypothetical protein [Allocatelliglobosispora scoriae]
MNTPNLRGQGPMALLSVFYAATAGLALYGQSDGIMLHLRFDRWSALAVAAVVELLAAVLFAFADWRRTYHGESAIAARLLAVVVAAGVAALNYYGHPDDTGQTMLFTGASVAAFLVLVLHTEARRRDHLRAAGRLPAQAPAYGPALWLRMPQTVWRARQLATANPDLGVRDSITAAETEAATAVRHKAIAAALRLKLTKSLDPVSSAIAMVSYDLDEVAARLAASVDYDRLTALLAADIDPDRLRPVADVAPEAAPRVAPVPRLAPKPKPAKTTKSTADLVVALAARHPELTPKQVAARLAISERTAQRYMPPRVAEDPATPVVDEIGSEVRELVHV